MNDKATLLRLLRTPSELESEFRDGIPSAVTQPHAETVGDYFKRLYLSTTSRSLPISLGAWPKMTAHLLSSKPLPVNSIVHSSGLVAWKGMSLEGVAQREAS